MTKREAAIITAVMGMSFYGENFKELHKYIEEKFERPINIHEMQGEEFWEKLKSLAMKDFIYLCNNINN